MASHAIDNGELWIALLSLSTSKAHERTVTRRGSARLQMQMHARTLLGLDGAFPLGLSGLAGLTACPAAHIMEAGLGPGGGGRALLQK